MPFGAVGAGVGAIGSMVGSGKQASATKKAAELQAQSADKATQLQRDEFNQVQQNEAPYLQAGANGLNQLQDKLPDLLTGFDPTKAGVPSSFSFDPSMVANDPAYQFAVSQGSKALERTAAAKGQTLAPATQEAIGQYVSGTASQFYNADQAEASQIYQQNYGNAFGTFQANQGNIFSRLSSLAAAGQGGLSQVNQAGANFATNAGSNMIGAGNAGAAAAIGVSNAQNSGLAGATSAFSSLMNNPSFQSSMKNWAGGTKGTSGSTYSGGNFDENGNAIG